VDVGSSSRADTAGTVTAVTLAIAAVAIENTLRISPRCLWLAAV
jgi:hypothetical protein